MNNAAAYCRVSTDKTDQLNSLETQKAFFTEYARKEGVNLVRIYADEGISGTKVKKRKEFQKLMEDAENGKFDIVLVKDISRFARNTVDLLQNIRSLKSMGIPTHFITSNMNSLGDSEFTLTIFGAMAQEESANISKRVKFGKKMNAEKGRVPNIVYGYDKIAGDYFSLKPNEREQEIIKQIFDWYTEEGNGALKISNMLNSKGVTTKRGCKWSQNAVCRILSNRIYIGEVINGKQEIADFLTSRRENRDKSEWFITEKPELKIIENGQFEKAQKILHSRRESFNMNGERHSNKFLFSTLIKCRECGWSFRRTVRTYKNTYVKWTCSGRSGHGADTCGNRTVIGEDELINEIDRYFEAVLKSKKDISDYMASEFAKRYKEENTGRKNEFSLRRRLEKIKKLREKYMDMYADDLISREELNEKIGGMKTEIETVETELEFYASESENMERLDCIVKNTFKTLEGAASVRNMTNEQLKRIIDRIEVGRDGRVDIYLKAFGETTPMRGI